MGKDMKQIEMLSALCIATTNEDKYSGIDGCGSSRLRATYAAPSLADYIRRTSPDCMEDALSDLLCDLRHLATHLKLDYAELDEKAEGEYDEEIKGEIKQRQYIEAHPEEFKD